MLSGGMGFDKLLVLVWPYLNILTKLFLVFRARDIAPTSIRALYGISDTRNATHGSDSDESAKREIGFFFPHFDSESWFETHEPFYRENRHSLAWDNEREIHYVP